MKRNLKPLVENIDKPKDFISFLKASLFDKVNKFVCEAKQDICNKLLVEAETKEILNDPASNKVYRTSPGEGIVRYQLMFMGKTYIVDFEPINKSASQFGATFYTKGNKNSDRVSIRYGITSVSAIEPLFERIFGIVKLFLQYRRPSVVRFIPGNGLEFPSQIHLYIYEPLKVFEKAISPKFAVIRGDAIKDGSAFVVKRGGSDNLKAKSWKPSVTAKKVQDDETK